MPCLRSKKNRFRKSLNTSPPGLLVVEVRRGELLRRRPAGEVACRCANRLRPASVSFRRFTSANRTCSITCWLSLPPGTCSRLITCAFGIDAAAISPPAASRWCSTRGRTGSSRPRWCSTAMSSPGKSVCSCCSSVVTGCSTTRSYCVRAALPQTIRLTVPGALAVDQDLARLHDDGVGDAGLVIGDARDVEVGRHDRRAAGGELHARKLRTRMPAPRRAGRRLRLRRRAIDVASTQQQRRRERVPDGRESVLINGQPLLNAWRPGWPRPCRPSAPERRRRPAPAPRRGRSVRPHDRRRRPAPGRAARPSGCRSVSVGFRSIGLRSVSMIGPRWPPARSARRRAA